MNNIISGFRAKQSANTRHYLCVKLRENRESVHSKTRQGKPEMCVNILIE